MSAGLEDFEGALLDNRLKVRLHLVNNYGWGSERVRCLHISHRRELGRFLPFLFLIGFCSWGFVLGFFAHETAAESSMGGKGMLFNRFTSVAMSVSTSSHWTA